MGRIAPALPERENSRRRAPRSRGHALGKFYVSVRDRDLQARGRFWIDESNGRVIKTELEVGNAPVTSLIVTTFRYDDTLHIDVPAEMRTSHVDILDGLVEGIATYGNFRRFE